MSKLLSASLAVAVLLAGFGVFYHYVVFLPAVQERKEEQARVDAEKQETEKLKQEAAQAARASDYYRCMNAVAGDYDSNWKRNCLARDRPEDCSLPRVLADNLGQSLKNAQARCLAEAKSGL